MKWFHRHKWRDLRNYTLFYGDPNAQRRDFAVLIVMTTSACECGLSQSIRMESRGTIVNILPEFLPTSGWTTQPLTLNDAELLEDRIRQKESRGRVNA